MTNYDEMTVLELRELAAERGIDLTGAKVKVKADIIERLSSVDADLSEPDPDSPEAIWPMCRIRGCSSPGKHQRTGYCTEHYRRYMNAQRVGTVT